MSELEEGIKKMDFRLIIFTSIITALSFVVGLFWRDAISETINEIIPSGQGLFYRYAAAMIATFVVVVIAYFIIRAQNIKINKIVRSIERMEEGRIKKIVKKMEEENKKRRKSVKKILSYRI
ncbi:MAG: DUF5654 family protein [Candidatus Aenigmarchaeota archaeon]|nr:DUF5654 family protein [Candidatus Aenigmarchaeota archaeon]MDI6722787.1 DUF5654 family protein [Candidatus Aenigmarchaeota archaeon]